MSSKVRQRIVDKPEARADRSSKTSGFANSTELDAAVVSASQKREFLTLSIYQIAAGMLFASSLALTFYVDKLAPYREIASRFIYLQNVTVSGTTYAGWWDGFYLFTAFVGVMTTRAVVQLLSYWLVSNRKDLAIKSKIRFTEQAWCLLYYGGAAVWGLVLLQSQPYGWNAERLWAGFPHYYIDPHVKRYYLTLFGYWLSQLVVIHLEERRKDHWQMFTHHIVTCSLILGSFAYSYTRIGHLVLIMMDTVDVFLSLAKCTKYLRAPTMLTDSIFLMFLISWLLLRHFLYMYETLYAAFPAVKYLAGRCVYPSPLGNGEELLGAAPIQCFSHAIHNVFFALTLILQAIILMWLVLIVKVVMRVIRGQGAADNRSDSED